jgi:hypothetical protein
VFTKAILRLKGEKTVVMVSNNKSLLGYFDRAFELAYTDIGNIQYVTENEEVGEQHNSEAVEL